MNIFKNLKFVLTLSILLIFTTVTANAQERPEIGYVGPSNEGLRVFSSKDLSKYGYMDEEGNIIVPCEYTSTADFVNGVGLVCKDNGTSKIYSIVNTKGKITLTFDPQLGSVNYFNGNGGIVTKYYDAATPGRSALIDGNGKLITGYDYYSLLQENRSPSYGVLWAEKMSSNGVDTKRGVLDWSGKTIIPFEYFDIINTEEGQSVLSAGKQVNGRPKYGYFYLNGTVLLPCDYDHTESFAEGFGAVQKDGKYAVINANGAFITEFVYDIITPYNEGLAIVVKNGKQGMIDTEGKEVIPCKYYYLSCSSNGYIAAQENETSPEVKLENPVLKERKINIFKESNWVYTDQEPIIQNGLTLAPMRKIAESLGYSVTWNNQSQTITLQNNERIIHLTIGSTEATVNIFDDGNPSKTVQLDAAPTIINGRTLIPVRFITESTGANVVWDGATRTININ